MSDYDAIFKQMDNIFKEVDNVFKQMDSKIKESVAQADALINGQQKWEPFISWIPRKIGKRWYWHSPIYRKYQFKDRKGYYVYGTEFDILKDSR